MSGRHHLRRITKFHVNPEEQVLSDGMQLRVEDSIEGILPEA